MHVQLRDLKPNPMRDFVVDPIDLATVEALKASIHEHGFWGGIACRQSPDGTIEIACGHHRVLAALEGGITTAEVFVRTNVDNAEMVRLYAMENGTQRANSTSSALAGTIASAVRFVAKIVLTGVCHKIMTNHDVEKIRGNLQSERGLGQRVVTDFLHDIPGINSSVVDQQLANLKSSGDYARILADVEREIQVEHAATVERLAEEEAAAKQARQDAQARQARAARAHAEETHTTVALRAKRATAKAAEAPKTFDFEGVAKQLKNAHQLAVFRKIVTGPALRDVLAVGEQAALAQRLVGLAAERDVELSAAFLRENITNLLLASKEQARARSAEEEAELRRADLAAQANVLQDNFLRSAYSLAASGKKLTRFLQETWPHEDPFPVKRAFLTTLQDVQTLLTALVDQLNTQTTDAPRARGRALAATTEE